MENCHAFTSPIKLEGVKFEIKLEQLETDELETIKTEVDSKINVKLETYKQENEIDESETLMQFDQIEIKSEGTEEGSNGILYTYLQQLNKSNEVFDGENNISKPNTSQSWKCLVCGSVHNNEDELKVHITSTHSDPSDVNYFKCDLCEYGTKYLDKLAGHRSRHRIQQKKQHKPPDVSEEEKTDSEFTTQKCGVCDVTYQTKSQLGEHIASSHKDPLDSNRFKCAVCDYVTEYFHRLIQHRSYHDCPVGTKWYHCHKCSYRSKQKNSLKEHAAKHKGISNSDFHKSPSEYRLKLKGNWEAHVCKHEGSSKADSDKSPSESVAHGYFVRHTTTGNDTELKPYQCPLCDYKSKYKGGAKKHMLRHQGWDEVKVYECDVCEFRTKRKFSLQKHMTRH